MDKDYYKILGVNESDTAENIKSAYRKLARKWHPDIAGNSPDILLKFKEINEAYDILSDKYKRAEYDKVRMFYDYAKNGSNSYTKTQHKETEQKTYSTNPQNKSFSFKWEDFIPKKQAQKSTEKKEKAVPKKGMNIFADVEISLVESLQGVEKVINVVQTGVCPKCGGRKFINGSLCQYCKGKGEASEHKKFTIKIPAGIKNNSKIRLANEGGAGINGGQNGDLYVTVHIKEPNGFKTDGLNIIKTVGITPFEAVLGTTIEINSLDGIYSVKIPPQTQNGQKIRLSGCGIVQSDSVGDIIIVVEIRIPKTLTNEEINLYKRLAEISSTDIRESTNDR